MKKTAEEGDSMEVVRKPKSFYEYFFKKFFRMVGFPEDDALLAQLCEEASVREYEKKEFVITKNEKQRYLYFLLSGTFRCFEVNGIGRELTNSFILTPGRPFIVAISFDEGDRACDTVQTMETGELLLVPLSVLSRIREEYPRIDRVLINALCDSFRQYHQIMEVRALKPAERYRWLKEDYPEAEARVQKQYLASFLDMHKAAYSRCQAEYEEEQAECSRRKTGT